MPVLRCQTTPQQFLSCQDHRDDKSKKQAVEEKILHQSLIHVIHPPCQVPHPKSLLIHGFLGLSAGLLLKNLLQAN